MPRVNVKDKRKQQLMEAGIASIARRGLGETTIAHVSKGAGMSRGIVNFYFTSKEKMLQETIVFLAEEYTQAWQAAFEQRRKETDSPVDHIETLLRTLLGDRHCSARRMAVWGAFLGEAGTNAAYAKVIHRADELLARQFRELWQKAGVEGKASDQRARQAVALIRGHHIMSALGDERRPSSYLDSWLPMLLEASAPRESKVTRIRAAAPVSSKAKKPHVPDVLPGQLDFGDLFTR